MTVWLIGEAPTRHTTEPFVGSAGNRLSKMAGFDVRKEFHCVNVLKEWPGRSNSKGAEFPVGPARRGAQELLRWVNLEDKLIVVGGRCAKKAFRFNPEIEAYEWTSIVEGTAMNFPAHLGWTRITYIPHPSGVNQHWNLPENVERLREFLDYVRKTTLTS